MFLIWFLAHKGVSFDQILSSRVQKSCSKNPGLLQLVAWLIFGPEKPREFLEYCSTGFPLTFKVLLLFDWLIPLLVSYWLKDPAVVPYPSYLTEPRPYSWGICRLSWLSYQNWGSLGKIYWRNLTQKWVAELILVINYFIQAAIVLDIDQSNIGKLTFGGLISLLRTLFIERVTLNP